MTLILKVWVAFDPGGLTLILKAWVAFDPGGLGVPANAAVVNPRTVAPSAWWSRSTG